jgi:hypothetical protein
MKCKREFQREDLLKMLGDRFVTSTYKEYRKNQLLSLEKSLLPAAQIQLEDLWGEDESGSVEELMAKANEAQQRVEELHKQIRALEKTQAVELAHKEHFSFVVARRQHALGVKVLRDRAARRQRGASRVETERRAFIQKCPVDACRGFLSTRWKCGLCGAHVCRECGAVKKGEDDPAHECKKEDVETMKLLHASDTKNCPSCGTPISKVSGCDQMWCPSCHTAFSWNTQKVLSNERVHNPHYFAWLQQNPDAQLHNADDADCGGIPTLNDVRASPLATGDTLKNLVSFVQRLEHHNAVTLPRLARPTTEKFLELRMRFLNQEIAEAHWKKELMRLSKKEEYERRVAQVYNMLVNAGSDLLRNFADHCREYAKWRAKWRAEWHVRRDLACRDGPAETAVPDAPHKEAQKVAEEKIAHAKKEAGRTMEEIHSLINYADEQLKNLSLAYRLMPYSVGYKPLPKPENDKQ